MTNNRQRPLYPPFWTWWLPSTLIGLVRAPLYGTIALCALSPLYAKVAALWPYSDRMWFIVGTMLVHSVLYVLLNGFFYLCDAYGYLQKYKLTRTSRMMPTKELIRETLRQGFVGQMVTGPVTLWVIYTYALSGAMPLPTDDLPDPFTIFRHLALAAAFNEITFYFGHRIFHEVPWLYRSVHKQHHQFVGTIGFAAEYAHPVEQILCNQGPTVGYCFYMAVHPLIWFVWLAWRLINTYETHSGFCFRGSWPQKYLGLTNSLTCEHHDFHHTVNKGAYGSVRMDWLFGSLDSFLLRETREKGSLF